MRTTIEIPDRLLGRLRTEAMRRNLRGFSPLVVEALERYFRSSPEVERRIAEELAAPPLTAEEARALDEGIARAQASWGRR